MSNMSCTWSNYRIALDRYSQIEDNCNTLFPVGTFNSHFRSACLPFETATSSPIFVWLKANSLWFSTENCVKNHRNRMTLQAFQIASHEMFNRFMENPPKLLQTGSFPGVFFFRGSDMLRSFCGDPLFGRSCRVCWTKTWPCRSASWEVGPG